MTKARGLLILAFIVVCAAGVVVGTAVDRHAHPDLRPEVTPSPELGELKLTPEQQAKLRSIWADVIKIRRDTFGKRHTMEQQRLEKVLALLTPEQKAEYEKIQGEIDHQNKDSEEQIRLATKKADAETREILSPAQVAKLDEIRGQRMGHGMGPHDMGGPPPMGMPGMPGMGPPGHHRDHDRGDHHRSTTKPTTAPAELP